jgi:SAM-dependent methyltransferase
VVRYRRVRAPIVAPGTVLGDHVGVSKVNAHGGLRAGLLPYGIDAPYVPAGLGAGAGVCFTVAAWRRAPWAAGLGTALLAQTALYLHTTARGKFRVWGDELDRLQLRGNEDVLDLGCGRGAVLIEAARRLPAGRAVGVDLWRGEDQSGNGPDVIVANAKAAGVGDRVEVRTADMTSLPFTDESFDVVTSALAIHNIPTVPRRHRALDEAMRVLRRGGRLLIADFRYVEDYCTHLGGEVECRRLGPATGTADPGPPPPCSPPSSPDESPNEAPRPNLKDSPHTRISAEDARIRCRTVEDLVSREVEHLATRRSNLPAETGTLRAPTNRAAVRKIDPAEHACSHNLRKGRSSLSTLPLRNATSHAHPAQPRLPVRPGDAALRRRRRDGRPPPLATNS